jgi:Tfp pilus assembly protein PilV
MTKQSNHPRGQIILLALVFFAVFVTVATALIGSTVTYSMSERHAVAQAQALNLAEAALDRAAYQLNLNSNYTGETDTPLGNGTFTIAVTNIDGVTKQITATGYVSSSTAVSAYRRIRAKVVKNSGAVTFHYGTQAGQGGIIFSNNAALIGNLYSNGNVIGSNGAYITGDTFVAGPTGSISGMCIGGTGASCVNASGSGMASAHSITNSVVTGAVYCQTGSGNNKPCDTSQGDPAPENYPIDDTNITTWENDAAAGTVINGNYTISSGAATLGPTKIIGNLTISGSAVVTLNNTVWVTGNISFSGSGGGARVKLANTYGSQSGLLIANGLISIGNNITFQDSGTSGSYIMLLSTSTCDENTAAAPCGNQNAINVSNNAAIVIANAQQGTVNFANNASVKEVVGKTIRLKNNVVIQYGSGLPNTLFQSGPGGSWEFLPGTYAITH